MSAVFLSEGSRLRATSTHGAMLLYSQSAAMTWPSRPYWLPYPPAIQLICPLADAATYGACLILTHMNPETKMHDATIHPAPQMKRDVMIGTRMERACQSR